MSTEKQIVEISGIKMEVDTRTATVRKIEAFKIGDPVKLLKKEYSGYKVFPGIIAGFEQFLKRPTIVIAYLEYAELKFESLYDGCEQEVIAAGDTDLDLNRDFIADKMLREIEKKETELAEVKAKREFFLKHFGALRPAQEQLA